MGDTLMNAALVGYGRMNQMVEAALEGVARVVGIVDIGRLARLEDVPERVDVILDFSHPDNLSHTLTYAASRATPAVIGTTNLTPGQLSELREAAKRAPILYSANFSLGVMVLKRAAQLVSCALGEDFDIEIIETHHGKKEDAPSGTAKALADIIDPAHTRPRVYGREGAVGARGREIGMHAVRGGTLAGEHSVKFLGEDEVIELRHEAMSRRVFAVGAARAAKWLIGRAPGLYCMEDVLWEGGR